MRRILLAAALFALGGCAVLDQSAKQPPDPNTQMAALAARIATLVEGERRMIDPKAKALVLDPELTEIAQHRARDMAAKNYLAHVGPDGETSASLLMAQDEKWQGLLGENLAAQHYAKQSGVDVDAFARRFLDEWVKSAPHRDNLAYPAYDRTGVGAAVNGDTVYVAQLFASGPAPLAGESGDSVATAFPTAAAAQNADDDRPPPLRLRGAEDAGPKRP
jgi:uncharacterized protein YkwD